MASYLNDVNTADKFLNLLGNATAWTAVTQMSVLPHVGDPGGDGTGNTIPSATKEDVNFNAAASGSMAKDGTTTQWASWAWGTQNVSWLSLWDVTTHLWNVDLGGSTTVNDGDDLTLASLTLTCGPVAP